MAGVVITAWDLGTFLGNATTTLQGWFKLLFVLFGVFLIGFGVYQLVKSAVQHGKGQAHWLAGLLCIFGGGVLMVGSWDFIVNIAAGGKKTLEDLGTGSTPIILPWWLGSKAFWL